jgi:phage-related protein
MVGGSESSGRPVVWVAGAKKELLAFPHDVVIAFGRALTVIQFGEHPPSASPLHGLGSGVYELRESHRSGAFRVVYRLRSSRPIYVLCAFQERSLRGRATPRSNMELIRHRMSLATARMNKRQ